MFWAIIVVAVALVLISLIKAAFVYRLLEVAIFYLLWGNPRWLGYFGLAFFLVVLAFCQDLSLISKKPQVTLGFKI